MIYALVGLLSGLIGGMGLGGGAVLVIYLTVFEGLPQFVSQGVNLLFFLPIGLIAVLIYAKKKCIDYKTTIILSLFALPGAVFGIFMSSAIGDSFVSKIFAGILILLGLKEIFSDIHLISFIKNVILKKE